MSWTARSDSATSALARTQTTESLVTEQNHGKRENLGPTMPLLSPSEHRMATSPGTLTPEDELMKSELGTRRPPERMTKAGPAFNTDPGPAHSKLSYDSNEREHFTADARKRQFQVVPLSIPVPQNDGVDGLGFEAESQKLGRDSDGVLRKDTLFTTTDHSKSDLKPDLKPAAVKLQPKSIDGLLSSSYAESKDVWGTPFPIEWLRTDRLSFIRTRHLRNPWNHDREVKVSRDGTELEPGIGEALLAEWEKTKSLTPPPIQTTED